MLNCSIERVNQAFLIRANDQLIPPYAYMTYQPARGRYQDFRKAGVRFVSVAVYSGDRGINPTSAIRPFRPGFMTAPGVYDFQWADEDFRLAICGAKPGEAFILPRLMLEMPTWWEEAHPEALCRDAAGVPAHCSFSSKEWLQAAVEAMEHFQAWLDESGWNEYVVGWHLAAGSTEEYIRPVLHPLQFLDYARPSLLAYRAWLAQKYGVIQSLNDVWGAKYASFDEIALPLPAARAFPMHGGLRDPQLERPVMDYYAFHSDELTVFIRALCAEAKRITRGEKLMGIFYGNISICDTEFGHNSMDQLLSCPDVDFFASPFCYTEARGAGADWPFQATLESANLHGKPWFVEADVRTLLSRPISQCMPFANPCANDAYDGPVWYGPDTLEVSLGDMLRALMRIMTHGGALWWFDMWGGWYDQAALMDFQRWAYAFYEQTARAGGLASRAELAVFLDEKALNCFAPRDGMAAAVCYEQMVQLGWLGAPYDSYLLSDFEAVDPARYRAAMLLSPCGLTDGQRAQLHKWQQNGRSLIFTGYAGYFFGELGRDTGIACTQPGQTVQLSAHADALCYPSCACHAPNAALLPAPQDVVRAENEAGEPVAVLHREPDYQTLWSIVPEIPAEMAREALLLAGGHIYVHGRDNVYAGGDYVAVHACADGVKRVYFPSQGRAFDAFSGERLPGTELYAEFSLKKGETRLIRLELTV